MIDWKILAPYFPTGPAKQARPAKPAKTLAEIEMERLSSAAMKTARRLASEIGANIERESASAYWVTHPVFDDDEDTDPLDDNHFCTDGVEALAAVMVYVEHFKAKTK